MATKTVSKVDRKRGSASVRGELVVGILPRGHTTWAGTAAQLVAEGVLPKRFAWPKAEAGVSWEQGGFEFWLAQARPADMTHRAWRESARDYWMLRRTLKIDGDEFVAEARLYEKERALAQEKWMRTPPGNRQSQRRMRALEDVAFRRFLYVLSLPKGRTASLA